MSDRLSGNQPNQASDGWVLRLSTTKCHCRTSGAAAIVRAMCAAKSASVRVGPLLASAPARHDIEVDHERLGPMSRVLKLTPLNFAWRKRQAWMRALQGSYPGQFVRAYNPFAACRPFGRFRYKQQRSWTLASNWSSTFGVNQERLRCGLRSSTFKKTTRMAGRDARRIRRVMISSAARVGSSE